MPRTLVLRPCAKINLTLRVGPRRLDGYHDVRTLMQSIAVSDTLTFTVRRGPFALATHSPGVPEGADNIVWRAADVLWRSAGRPGEPRDIHVRLEKKIPPAAGLGGGSADAAATLSALNTLWGIRHSKGDLVEIGAGIGSDVPFFLQGGTALAAGRGEEIYPVDDVARLGVIVIKPSFGVSTAEAYRWLDEDREEPPPDASGRQPPPRSLDVGWSAGPIGFVNDLQAPVARRHPAIIDMVDACLREGAIAAAMTGSGSAVFGLFAEAVARRAARRLQRPEWLVMLTRTLTRREAGRRLRL
jgi:4-diphosphocytidyl-2-C-methyl-D-erythritol kinase